MTLTGTIVLSLSLSIPLSSSHPFPLPPHPLSFSHSPPFVVYYRIYTEGDGEGERGEELTILLFIFAMRRHFRHPAVTINSFRSDCALFLDKDLFRNDFLLGDKTPQGAPSWPKKSFRKYYSTSILRFHQILI